MTETPEPEPTPDPSSVHEPEPAVGAVGADDDPYDLPEDFDPAHETRDLHENGDAL